MVIGTDASEEEVLSMINARALMQDPQMVSQIMDDVARQKGTDYANRIGAQVLAGRNNIVGTLGQTIGQIASDAETGWNAPFNTGYSGREENMEGAGGVADQASAYIQEKFQTQGESGAARAQLEILDEFKKRMEESLKADTYDREMWQKVLTGVVGRTVPGSSRSLCGCRTAIRCRGASRLVCGAVVLLSVRTQSGRNSTPRRTSRSPTSSCRPRAA